MKNKNVRYSTYAAVLAAVYTAITALLAPISMGAVQCRISEALTALPMLSASSVPGLFVGCLLSNVFFSGNIYDIVFGSLTTLVAAILTRKFKAKPFLAMTFPVLLNAVVVGGYIGLFLDNSMAVWLCMLTVGLGQAVACYGLGLPLYALLKKHAKKFEN